MSRACKPCIRPALTGGGEAVGRDQSNEIYNVCTETSYVRRPINHRGDGDDCSVMGFRRHRIRFSSPPRVGIFHRINYYRWVRRACGYTHC